MALFIPTYFSTIAQYTSIVNSSSITFEVEENYQKQSYRNRCYIFGANGKQLLNIPISNTNKISGKIKMRAKRYKANQSVSGQLARGWRVRPT